MSASKRKVVLFGAAGQLGADLLIELQVGSAVVAPAHEEVDVAERAAVAVVLDRERPDWVVTTAAFHDVDRCQEEPARTLRVNAEGTAILAAEAARVGAGLLYVSTDYVFSGRKGAPYVESDVAEPVNVYGATKLAGEALARALNPRTLIVRTAGLYGAHPCRGKGGRNFVDLMLRLGRERGRVRVVDDEATSPTYTAHLARAIRQAVDADLAGTLHLAAAGHCTWKEFAEAIFQDGAIDAVVERADPGEFPKKTPRPAFSPLISERGDWTTARRLPGWREGLRAYLSARSSATGSS